MRGIGFRTAALAGASALAFTFTFTFSVAAAAGASASADTFAGEISDSMCRAKHETPSEGGPELSKQECTNACVRGGSKYVLVTGDGVLVIANQDHDGLEAHAGAMVTVTGELDGEALVVSSIATSGS